MNKKWIVPMLMTAMLYTASAHANMKAGQLLLEQTMESNKAMLQVDDLLTEKKMPIQKIQHLALARTCDDPWYVKSGIQFIACLFR